MLRGYQNVNQACLDDPTCVAVNMRLWNKRCELLNKMPQTLSTSNTHDFYERVPCKGESESLVELALP